MSFDNIRPILSGLIGALLAIALSYFLARWVPAIFRGKSAATLAQDYRVAIRLANATFVAGILAALTVHQWLAVPRSDWRPLSIGFGLTLLSPLMTLPIAAFVTHDNAREAFVAYAINQKLPPLVICLICGMGFPLLVVGLAALAE